MAGITPFNLTLLRTDEVRGFCQEIDAKVQPVTKISATPPGLDFHNAIVKYENLRKIERNLQYSDLIAADNYMDQALASLQNHLKTFLQYPVDDVRTAAKVIWEAIDQFGTPAKLSLSEEHPIIKNILTVLDDLDPTLLEKTMVNAWVNVLRERYDALVEMIGRYDRERVNIGPGRIKAARDEMIAAWKPLCRAINGWSLIEPSAELDALIDEINVRIQTRKTTIKQRKAAKKNGASASVSIPTDEPESES